MSAFFTNKKTLTILLFISITIAILSLWQREIGTDDAWLGEQAYWMAEQGHVKSELFYGMNNHHIRHLTYHRLHVWHGVVAYKLFGWSAYLLKSILLLYFILFLYVSHIYIRKHDIFHSDIEFRVFYLLVFAFALMAKLSFIYRPDVMVMTFGFMSFFMLHSAIKGKDVTKAILSGLLAGACVLTHLNGVVYVFAGGVLFLITRNYRLLIYFSIAAFVISMLYFIEFRNWGMFSEFLYQLRSSPALSEKDFSVTGSLLKFLSGYKSYFHKGSDASYTLLLIFVFWTQRQTIFADQNLRIIFIYFIVLAVGLALVSPGLKSLYLVYHAPYAFLLMAVLYKQIFVQTLARQRAFAFLLVIFLLTQWGETFSLFRKRTPDLEQTHRQVSQSLGFPEGARIVAPLTYVFNEVDKYTIQCFHAYRAFAGQGLISLVDDFFRVASEDKRMYLILTDHHLRDLHVSKPKAGDRFGDYLYKGLYGPYHGFQHVGQF